MEIKCQLDAPEVFIADLIACSTCFRHHYAHHQELKSIIQWLLPVVFRAVVFKLLVWCGAEVCVQFAGCCSILFRYIHHMAFNVAFIIYNTGCISTFVCVCVIYTKCKT